MITLTFSFPSFPSSHHLLFITHDLLSYRLIHYFVLLKPLTFILYFVTMYFHALISYPKTTKWIKSIILVWHVNILFIIEPKMVWTPGKEIHVTFLKDYLIYLFLAASDLRCCAWAFSSCSERGLLFVVVNGLLSVVAPLAAEHGL